MSYKAFSAIKERMEIEYLNGLTTREINELLLIQHNVIQTLEGKIDRYEQQGKLFKTDEWHEDYGDCLFFHFFSMEEPPAVLVSTPLSSDFNDHEDGTWTHFLRCDLNDIFNQVERHNN